MMLLWTVVGKLSMLLAAVMSRSLHGFGLFWFFGFVVA
jgi:hypothetical protein